jgi:AcrR family transcriptional regulator
LFHYHFKSKEAFAKRVLQSGYENYFRDFLKQMEISDDDPIKVLEHGLLLYGRFIRDHRKSIASLFKDTMDLFGPSATFMAERNAHHLHLFSTRIKDCQEAGQIIKGSPDQLAVYVLSAIGAPPTNWTMLEKPLIENPSQGMNEQMLEKEVYSDEALANRVALCMKALRDDKKKK